MHIFLGSRSERGGAVKSNRSYETFLNERTFLLFWKVPPKWLFWIRFHQGSNSRTLANVFSTAGLKIYNLRRACGEPLSISCFFYSVRSWDFNSQKWVKNVKYSKNSVDTSANLASAILPGLVRSGPSLFPVHCAGSCGPCRRGYKLRCPMA